MGKMAKEIAGPGVEGTVQMLKKHMEPNCLHFITFGMCHKT